MCVCVCVCEYFTLSIKATLSSIDEVEANAVDDAILFIFKTIRYIIRVDTVELLTLNIELY
jgi:hypothetical protein